MFCHQTTVKILKLNAKLKCFLLEQYTAQMFKILIDGTDLFAGVSTLTKQIQKTHLNG
jgi:hypothetical protein